MIHNRLNVLRAERGISRKDLADAVGVNFQTIGYIERGDYSPSLELALKIAGNAPLSNYAITQALPRIADLSASDGLFMESLISSIAQGDEAAKERVRAFLEKRAAEVAKS